LQELGLSLAVMFISEVLWYLGCCSEAAVPANKPKRRPKPPGSTDCQSVPHHVLWQKLDLNPSGPHRDRIPLPVERDLIVDETRRRRRSHSALSESRTSRSELASYRRLIRSVDQQQHDATSSSDSSSSRASRRRLRRLRRRLRRQPATTGGGPAAHQCHLERYWKRMSRGVFPPYVETGRCSAQTTCMFGLYECTRRRYAVKILRRVPRRCNPLPSVSVNTTYEHVWRFAEYHVTVGCECARKRRPGRVDFETTTTTPAATSAPASGD